MAVQESKKVIDIGEVGNASTGDILYDGGEKINHNFDSIYNAFGDQRLGAIADGENLQYIHATGYYQKATQYEFRSPVPLGSMWDIDAKDGAISPIITAGKVGECVEFVNSNGTVSVSNPLVISLSGGSFAGVAGSLVVTTPFSKVVCWCVKVENSISTWNYSVVPMFGDDRTPINGTYSASSIESKIKIAHASEFDSIKLMVSGSNPSKTKMRTSEINLLVDATNKQVYTTEFAVIRVGNINEEDEIINISFEIDLSSNLNMVLSSSITGMKVAVKSIATQKIGAA